MRTNPHAKVAKTAKGMAETAIQHQNAESPFEKVVFLSGWFASFAPLADFA